MAEYKTMPLTTSIKNYLLQRIAKAGTEPERLPSEMELCAKFGVSRITVRRAIESLETIDYIIRLPGRQGAFTNPAVAMAVPHLVGILGGDGSRNYINTLTAEILSGFMTEMRDTDCDFEFMLLNITGNRNTAQEIENMALDGLLWIMPEEDMAGQIDMLIRKEFPIVTLGSIYNSAAALPKKNTICRNFAQIGFTSADWMLKHHHKCVARIGFYNISAEIFHREMRKAGAPLTMEYFIDPPADIEEKLTKLLESRRVDAIISNGGLDRYRRVIQVLRRRKEWTKIPLYLDDYRLERKLKETCTDLSIETLPTTPYLKSYGQTAGHYMKRMISGEIKTFETVQIPSNEEEK